MTERFEVSTWADATVTHTEPPSDEPAGPEQDNDEAKHTEPGTEESA